MLNTIFLLIIIPVCLCSEWNRTVPDPESYLYHEITNISKIIREYVVMETDPNTAILCPENYSIDSITQKLVVPSNSTSLVINSNWLKDELNMTVEDAISRRDINMPCPTLTRCIGYQACLFKFSNEFCLQDPAPSLRKLLYVNISCTLDAILHPVINSYTEGNRTIRKWWIERASLVLYLTYKSRIDEDKIRNYERTNINHVNLKEADVFDVHCPTLKEAYNMRYQGECVNEPPSAQVVSEELWRIIGRCPSSSCRKELKQVYCAYKYHSMGACVPPLFTEKAMDKYKTKYNYISLPNSVLLPDDSHLKILKIHPDNTLMPSKLAFLLLVHKDIPAVVELLQLIYRPDHWYVFHVDLRSTQARQDLHAVLKNLFPNVPNIYVLPEERSFATSWGSYEIIRAELEGFQELLKMGLWDFAINLSGADLPVRDIDDLSAASAAYRGFNFLTFHHAYNTEKAAHEPLKHQAFHACDGYVFNVSRRQLPKSQEFEMHSSPQWGMFSREFIKYVVDEESRTEKLNKFQFYLQTTLIPDESYMASVLMNSPFNNTLKKAVIHLSKEFTGSNIDNLCRHGHEADFCGQGPGTYEMEDLHQILEISSFAFFTRKFYTSHPHETRNAVAELVHGKYYEMLLDFLPREVVMKLIDDTLKALPHHVPKLKHSPLKIMHLLRLQVFPKLIPTSPCCQFDFLNHLPRLVDYRMWLDFNFVDTSNNQVYLTRASLDPITNGRNCYCDGHLKMIFATTWTVDISPNLKTGVHQTLPVPYFPAFGNSVWLLLVFEVSELDKSYSGVDNVPILFEKRENLEFEPINITIQIYRPDGSIHCQQKKMVSWANKTSTHNEDNDSSKNLLFDAQLDCETMPPGLWKISIFQDHVPKPMIYDVNMFLTDVFHNKANIDKQVTDVAKLWNLTRAALLPFPNIYDQNILKENQYKENKISSDYQNENFLNKRSMMESWFTEWLLCHGGTITCMLFILFFYHGIVIPFSNRISSRKIQKIFYSLLLLGCSILVQYTLSLHYCK